MASIINASTSPAGIVQTADGTGILALQTAGTTAVTIDASQNVFMGSSGLIVGTSGSPRLYVSGTTPVVDSGAGGQQFIVTSSETSGGDKGGVIGLAGPSATSGVNIKATIAGKYDSAVGGNAGYMQFATLGSAGDLVERMRINSSGNVGIGTTTPNAKLDVAAATGALYTNIRTGDTNNAGVYVENSQRGYFLISASNGFSIYDGTSSADRIRITSGGEVYIAGTTDRGAFNLQCNGTGVWGAGAYTNGSDERIKENITPLDTGLDVVAKLNPVTYKYKEDWSKDQSIQTGFIAQDLLVALEGKNYVDGIVNQSSEYMSVAYQNIIPILTKAIQEQQTIINDLKTRIETLEAK